MANTSGLDYSGPRLPGRSIANDTTPELDNIDDMLRAQVTGGIFHPQTEYKATKLSPGSTIFANREDLLGRIHQGLENYPDRETSQFIPQRFIWMPKQENAREALRQDQWERPVNGRNMHVGRMPVPGEPNYEKLKRHFNPNIFNMPGAHDGRIRADGKIMQSWATGQVLPPRQTPYEASREERKKRGADMVNATDRRNVLHATQGRVLTTRTQLPKIGYPLTPIFTDKKEPAIGEAVTEDTEQGKVSESYYGGGGRESFYAPLKDAYNDTKIRKPRFYDTQQQPIIRNQIVRPDQVQRPTIVEHIFLSRDYTPMHPVVRAPGQTIHRPFISEPVQFPKKRGKDLQFIPNRRVQIDADMFGRNGADALSFVGRKFAPQRTRDRDSRPGPGFRTPWALPWNRAFPVPQFVKETRNRDNTIADRTPNKKANWSRSAAPPQEGFGFVRGRSGENGESVFGTTLATQKVIVQGIPVLPPRGVESPKKAWQEVEKNDPALAARITADSVGDNWISPAWKDEIEPQVL